MIRISDNSERQLTEDEQNHLTNLKKISQLKISNKVVANEGLLVFSNEQETIEDEYVFSVNEGKMRTNNLMGFIGLNNTEVTIQSRFSSEGNDYFLHYMLQKVYSINLFDLKHRTSNENIFDFLMYLFPFFLKKALRQGIYKEYKRKEYNNSNIKGAINIAQHLKRNIPFRGKVAYRAREQSYDNNVTQLIRHTIEFIKKHKLANNILLSDSETQQKVNEIIQATPTFENNSRTMVINNNLRPMAHPYFSEYTDLQSVCLQILRYQGLKYGQDKDKIYGILFDGAWLWEEYTNSFLKECGFKHPRNDNFQGGVKLFKNVNGYIRYPDFWKEGFIIDAKYKRLKDKNITRDDMHQIITYMYIKRANIGGFIFPHSSNESEKLEKEIGHLNGYNGIVKKWSFPIPVDSLSFDEFSESIHQNELVIKELIKANDEVLIKTSSIYNKGI